MEAPAFDGGSAITGYEVSRDNGSIWVAASSATGHTFTGLSGMEYTFRVRAVNGAGNGVEASAKATSFVVVTDITGVPTTATAKTPLTLAGTVVPADATNKNIVWSVKNAGTTGASISGNTLNTKAAGKVIVTATITNGASASSNYTKDFNITVSGVTNSPELSPINPLKAWMRNGMLHVEGLTAGETLSVYSATGQLIYKGVAASEEANIPLRAEGVYIIQSGENTVKVVYE